MTDYKAWAFLGVICLTFFFLGQAHGYSRACKMIRDELNRIWPK